jgi:carboxylate-amine ligase
VVLLSDGPSSSAWYEHRELSRRLGMRLATGADLGRSGDQLVVRGERGSRRVDVIYRRIDDERLTDPRGGQTELGELLTEPLRAGTVGCVNSPGSGVADDKAVHTYVDRFVDFYLGEPLLLPSVRGHDLGEPEQRDAALPRLGELVVKPRSEFGGQGVLIGPLASPAALEAAATAIRREPHRYVAQEPVALSVHPTVCGDAIEGRHVDLRPFVLSSAHETFVVPGGLTRFARPEGEMVVNSGRGGGAKDTWVL